jgi:hypothetical protein
MHGALVLLLGAGQVVQAAIPADHLGFQVGEAMQVGGQGGRAAGCLSVIAWGHVVAG